MWRMWYKIWFDMLLNDTSGFVGKYQVTLEKSDLLPLVNILNMEIKHPTLTNRWRTPSMCLLTCKLMSVCVYLYSDCSKCTHPSLSQGDMSSHVSIALWDPMCHLNTKLSGECQALWPFTNADFRVGEVHLWCWGRATGGRSLVAWQAPLEIV